MVSKVRVLRILREKSIKSTANTCTLNNVIKLNNKSKLQFYVKIAQLQYAQNRQTPDSSFPLKYSIYTLHIEPF